MSSHSHSHSHSHSSSSSSSRDDSSTRASTTSFDTQQSTTSTSFLFKTGGRASGSAECRRFQTTDTRRRWVTNLQTDPWVDRPTLDPFHSIDASFVSRLNGKNTDRASSHKALKPPIDRSIDRSRGRPAEGGRIPTTIATTDAVWFWFASRRMSSSDST